MIQLSQYLRTVLAIEFWKCNNLPKMLLKFGKNLNKNIQIYSLKRDKSKILMNNWIQINLLNLKQNRYQKMQSNQSKFLKKNSQLKMLKKKWMQKMMEEEGGWVKETRGKNFLHKKSGTGGGHIYQNISQNPQENQQTHIVRNKNIKEMILGQPCEYQYPEQIRQQQQQQQQQQQICQQFTQMKLKNNNNLDGQQQQQINNVDYTFNNIETNDQIQKQRASPFFSNNLQAQENNQPILNIQDQNNQPLQQQERLNIARDNKIKKEGSLSNKQQLEMLEKKLQLLNQMKDQQTEDNQLFNNFLSEIPQIQQQLEIQQVPPNNLEKQEIPQLKQEEQFQQKQEKNQNLNIKNSEKGNQIQTQLEQKKKNQEADQLEDTTNFNSGIFQQPGQQNLKLKGLSEAFNQQQNQIIDTWKQVLLFLTQDKYDEAFQTILNSGDDIYLIRLLVISADQLSKLSQKTLRSLITRFTQVVKSDFIKKIWLDLLQSSDKLGTYDQLTIEEQNQLLGTLTEISNEKSIIGKRAKEIHQSLISKEQ
eukprot:TRINITY_DN3546_c0_g2_i1.p1 TRINITY_DN3546_c0_g2~~TRINITY_DN3546_c0_g2_i1.p1  ORF type:complete len:533 (-),score=116.77 TRINITY_DN3546_c0_g2_i1:254-1852(-)